MATQPNPSTSNGRHSESAVVYSDHPKAILSRERRGYLRTYQKTWIAQRRQQWIDENGPCAKCGSSKNPEVDHIDPSDKEIPTRALWSMSPQNPRRVAELAKCQVLCEDCHKEKTRRDLAAYSRQQPHFNRTGARGVTLEKCGRYRARGYKLGKRITIGWFDTAKQAGLAVIQFYRLLTVQEAS